MLVLGLDAAVAWKKFGYAIARFDGARLDLDRSGKLDSEANVPRILGEPLRMADRALIAVDAPLGWPAALGCALTGHCGGKRLIADPDQLFRRETDRFVKARTGKQPLDVGADRIARTAWRALEVLGRLEDLLGETIPLAWASDYPERVAAIEVYPGAMLRVRGLPDSGYKKVGEIDVRRKICTTVARELPGLDRHVNGSPDAFDACLCLLAARDFLDGKAMPPEDCARAKQEGWIWVRSTQAGDAAGQWLQSPTRGVRS